VHGAVRRRLSRPRHQPARHARVVIGNPRTPSPHDLNRVDERFASMGSQARVRLESGVLFEAELERLAAGVRALLEDGGRPATMPPDVRYAISCGGDIAVGGGLWGVAVASARTGEEVHRLSLHRGGVATSGIHERLWQRPDGTFAHHLLDPSTGEPAWTGLVAVSAAGPGALDAEVLAKTALLL